MDMEVNPLHLILNLKVVEFFITQIFASKLNASNCQGLIFNFNFKYSPIQSQKFES